MERVGEILPRLTKQELLEKFGSDDEFNPRKRFAQILRPLVDVEISDYHMNTFYSDFDAAREDMKSCMQCDGVKCISSIKDKHFYSLCIQDSYQTKQPRFRVYPCIDPVQRKKAILEAVKRGKPA